MKKFTAMISVTALLLGMFVAPVEAQSLELTEPETPDIVTEDPPQTVGCAGRNEWKVQSENEQYLDGTRKFYTRQALQVQYDSCTGKATWIRAYAAVKCKYGTSYYPCSFTHTLEFEGYDNLTLEKLGPLYVANSGDDGFWSRYSHWRRVNSCNTYRTYQFVENVGIKGVRFYQGNGDWTSWWTASC